MDTEKSH